VMARAILSGTARYQYGRRGRSKRTRGMTFPPLHPAVVHFPIALLTFAVLAEFVGYIRNSDSARSVAWWSWIGATIGGAISVAAGYSDMWRTALGEDSHELVHLHLKVGWVLVVVVVALTLWRLWLRTRPARTVGRTFLTFAVLGLALAYFQGWFGGEMTYAHGAGVAAAGQGVLPAEAAQRNVTNVANFLRKVPFMAEGEEPAEHQHGETQPAPIGEKTEKVPPHGEPGHHH
jgi:uncharacterized membrane protein